MDLVLHPTSGLFQSLYLLKTPRLAQLASLALFCCLWWARRKDHLWAGLLSVDHRRVSRSLTGHSAQAPLVYQWFPHAHYQCAASSCAWMDHLHWHSNPVLGLARCPWWAHLGFLLASCICSTDGEESWNMVCQCPLPHQNWLPYRRDIDLSTRLNWKIFASEGMPCKIRDFPSVLGWRTTCLKYHSCCQRQKILRTHSI